MVNSMRKMKDSGIEWIECTPENWNLVRLKDFFNFEKGKNAAQYTQEYIGLNRGSYPVYSGQTENDGIMGMINSFDYDLNECLFTTTVGAKVMTPKILNGKFNLSQNCLIMNKINDCDIRYFYYSLLPLFNYEKSLIPTYMQPSLRISDLNKYQFYIPSIVEQQKIADYLDKKVALIDNIIEKTKESIDEYKKYKQALIAEVVTKGLNPNVKMKDSGIEWVGDIPEHWEDIKLKNIASGETNSFVDGDWIESNVIVEDGIRYLTTGNIGEGIFKEQGNGFISIETLELMNCLLVYPGDLIISRLNNPLGRACKLPNTYDKYVIAVDNVVLRPDLNKFNVDYLIYLMNIDDYSKNANMVARGTTMPRISRTILGNLHLLKLPISEQEEIVKFLNPKISQLEQSILNKNLLINELELYKKSLIYEVVTGKKDVN